MVSIATAHNLGVKLSGLLSEEADVAPGSQADDLESVRMATNHVEGLAADRPGRTEYSDSGQRTIHFR
jgi:hypothetical protein